MKKYFLVAVLFFGVFVSCKKSTSTNTSNPGGDSCSITAAHLEGSYIATSAYYTSALYTGDVFSNPLAAQVYPACKRDDIITLDSVHVYTYTDAGTVCSTNGSATGTWDLKGDTLIRTTGGASDSAVVTSYDCQKAIISYNNVVQAGDNLKVTFTKQ